MEHAPRYFKLKANRSGQRVTWVNRHTLYQGKLISMTSRVVRLFAQNPADQRPYVDLSYDWVVPIQ